MKYLKLFEKFENIYDVNWNKIAPNTITVFDTKPHKFKLGNIMKHADMVQVTYENANNEWGIPSTLEFDFFFSKNSIMRIDIDITLGDAMISEFYIESPNKLGITQKTDYKFSESSIEELVKFLNLFNGFKLNKEQFKFLIL
jgi:hypothetical protein